MAMTSAVRRMVLKGGSTEELREQAVKDGIAHAPHGMAC